MTPREELLAIFQEHDSKYPSAAAWLTGVKEAILAWHTRQTPQVTREQVEDVLRKHNIYLQSDGKPWWNTNYEGLRDELLALLTGTPKSKWCEHITWKLEGGGYWLYQDQMQNPYGFQHTIRPTDHWDICPVQGCHAPRPCAAPRPSEPS